MPKYSANMAFTFIVPPEGINVTEGSLPTIKIDMSESSSTMQAFLLKILPLLTITANDGAENFIFETSDQQ